MKDYFTLEILFEITKYFSDTKDYFYLAHTCKYFYELMLMKENYLFEWFNEILFNYFELTLTNDLPDYLFKFKKLQLGEYNNDYNLLQKFTNVTTLKSNTFIGKYLQFVPNLEELNVKNIYNLNENSFTNLKQLKILSISHKTQLQDEWLKNLHDFLIFSYCDEVTDDYLNNLNNLVSLNIKGCRAITGICLKNLQLQILHANVFNLTQLNYIQFLNNLTYLDISITIKETNNKDINTSFLLKLVNLEKLYLSSSSNFIHRNEDFYNLKKLKELKMFDAKKSLKFTGKCFQNFTKLEKLFCCNYIKVKYLNCLTNIKCLHLKFFDKYFNFNDNLSHLKKLEKIEFNSISELNMNSDLNNFPLFTNLKDITINLATVNGNFDNILNLTTLDLWKVKIKDDQILNLENLTKLEIAECPFINGECFLKFKNLKILKIHDCEIINFKYLSSLKQLTDLGVRETKIEDKDLEILNNIRYLDIVNCENLITGRFLLNMNKLTHLFCLDGILANKMEIEKVKKEIEKGSTLKIACEYTLSARIYNDEN